MNNDAPSPLQAGAVQLQPEDLTNFYNGDTATVTVSMPTHVHAYMVAEAARHGISVELLASNLVLNSRLTDIMATASAVGKATRGER